MGIIKGVIFDMDGVLVNSEPFIAQAAIAMFRQKGITVQEQDFKPFIGAGENRYLGGVAEKYHVDIDIEMDKKTTYDFYLEMVQGRLKALPGVYDFIGECRKRNLKIAIATSTDFVKMKANIEEIGLRLDTFDAVVDGLMVERKKPYPDIYEMTSKAIGLLPQQCLVVEDALNGVAAARSAGAKVLALQTSFTAAELQDADWILPDLSFYQNIIHQIFGDSTRN